METSCGLEAWTGITMVCWCQSWIWLRGMQGDQPGGPRRELGQLSSALAAAQKERAQAAAEVQALQAANNGLQVGVARSHLGAGSKSGTWAQPNLQGEPCIQSVLQIHQCLFAIPPPHTNDIKCVQSGHGTVNHTCNLQPWRAAGADTGAGAAEGRGGGAASAPSMRCFGGRT